jgi:hypothetical protein
VILVYDVFCLEFVWLFLFCLRVKELRLNEIALDLIGIFLCLWLCEKLYVFVGCCCCGYIHLKPWYCVLSVIEFVMFFVLFKLCFGLVVVLDGCTWFCLFWLWIFFWNLDMFFCCVFYLFIVLYFLLLMIVLWCGCAEVICTWFWFCS